MLHRPEPAPATRAQPVGRRAPRAGAAVRVGGVASNDRFHEQAMTDSTASKMWNFNFWIWWVGID